MVLRVISDELWAVLEPLLNEARPWAAPARRRAFEPSSKRRKRAPVPLPPAMG